MKDKGGRKSVASKFDDAAAVHHLSLHQKISPLNFYQFLQKEFPLFDHSAGSNKAGKIETRIKDSNLKVLVFVVVMLSRSYL